MRAAPLTRPRILSTLAPRSVNQLIRSGACRPAAPPSAKEPNHDPSPLASPGDRRLRLSLLSGLVLLQALLAVSQAQITLDGSLGPRGPLTGPNYRIGAELGQIRGGNLFHSFGEFNVPTGGSATFTGPNTHRQYTEPGHRGAAVRDRWHTAVGDRRGQSVSAQSERGAVWAECQLGGQWVVSRQHGGFLRFADGAKFSAMWGRRAC